ncbi:MAG: endolytic transglycosylase MltG [Pseudomonadota bacterium]
MSVPSHFLQFLKAIRYYLLAVGVTLGVLCAGTLWHVWSYLNTTQSKHPAGIDIAPGSSFNVVLDQLHFEEAVKRPIYLKAYARFKGVTGDIKAGEYSLDAGLTPVQILDQLIAGRVVQHNLTLVEGLTFREWRAILANASPVLVNASAALGDDELMAAIGANGEHPEGLFMPDTYAYSRGSSDIDLLRRAYDAMQAYLNAAWAAREEGLPLNNSYDALILASIVEKETGVAEERPLIAGVFVSRLHKGMKLQTDPTIIYGLGEEFDGDIKWKHLRQDTPYNTYTRHGLTPTPIAMPGRAAIDAVLHPAETEALYFVSKNDGSHQFSRTLAEHEAAVDKYQRNK